MSEDEATRFTTDEETDEVEGHAVGRKMNDEGAADEGDDDVEAHVTGAKHPKRL
jgi:hypothetical protein